MKNKDRVCRICGKHEAETLLSVKRAGRCNTVWACKWCEKEHNMKLMLDRKYWRRTYRQRLRRCKKLCQMCLKNPVTRTISETGNSGTKKIHLCDACYNAVQRVRYSPHH